MGAWFDPGIDPPRSDIESPLLRPVAAPIDALRLLSSMPCSRRTNHSHHPPPAVSRAPFQPPRLSYCLAHPYLALNMPMNFRIPGMGCIPTFFVLRSPA